MKKKPIQYKQRIHATLLEYNIQKIERIAKQKFQGNRSMALDYAIEQLEAK